MRLSYLALDAVFLVLLLGLDQWILRTHVAFRLSTYRPLPILLILTLVFDNLLTGLPIVTYDTSLTLGIRLGFAPIEDFAYALAMVIIVRVIWNYYGQTSR